MLLSIHFKPFYIYCRKKTRNGENLDVFNSRCQRQANSTDGTVFMEFKYCVLCIRVTSWLKACKVLDSWTTVHIFARAMHLYFILRDKFCSHWDGATSYKSIHTSCVDKSLSHNLL